MAANFSALASRRSLVRLGSLHRSQSTIVTPVASSASPPASAEWLQARPFEEIPGPKPLPIIGNMLRFLPPAGEFSNLDMVEVIIEMQKRYGNITKVVGIPGRKPIVYAFDPVDIEKVMRNEGPLPERSTIQSQVYYRKVMRKEWFEVGIGVAFGQGEEWYNFRKKVNKQLMQPRSAKMYVPPIDSVALDFVDRMVELRDENGKMPSDFSNELNKWSLESIALVALDARLGCLERNLPPDSEPQRLIDAAHVVFDAMMKLDLKLSPWKYISTPTWRRFVKALDCFYEVSMRHINEAMERIKARGVADVSQRQLSVLEKLLLTNDDPRIACVMALDMMFAGIDTTANATASTLYFLCKNPEAQEKLYQELCLHLPDLTTPLTAEILEDCKYLKACVKESMRLKPVSVVNMRRVFVDNLVLSNYRVPRGVDVMAPHYVITNSEEHFPRASEFLPERWIKDAAGNFPARSAHPFAFLPFGYGARICIGKRFAEFEIHSLLARIVRRFRLEFEGDAAWKTHVMHMISTPLTFKITERNADKVDRARF